jgi:basic membrane lipoprotein Med (substrate-binding protein (PBP1-ABC) superfamily)
MLLPFRHNMSRSFYLLACLCISLACGALAAPQFKAGFIFSGPFTDFGYNYNQELARITVTDKLLDLGYNVTTELYENATYVEADLAISSMTARGFDLVVMTTNYYNDLLNASRLAAFPRTKFVVQAMPGPSNNSVGLASDGYTARFVAGAMCGSVTKSNKIGFVGPFPFSFIINQINAFALGARKVNPKVEVVVVWTFSFLDPLLSAKAAEYLVREHGIDCGAAQQDDDTVQRVFQANKIPSTGANGDTRITAGNYVYFSQLEDTAVWYWRFIQSILNGTFDQDFGRQIRGTVLGDGIQFTSFSPLMPYETVQLVKDYTNAVSNKSERIFCGSLMQQEGYSIGTDGCMSGYDIVFMPKLFSFVANPLNMTLDLALTKLSVKPSSGLGIALFVITSLLVAVCIFFIFDISRYREAEIIRTASPFFCVLILVGFVVGLMSVYGWADTPTFSICQMRIWLGGIGFATVFGALLVKNWRIRQIFANESLEIFAITNKELLLQGVLPALVIEIIILAVWCESF